MTSIAVWPMVVIIDQYDHNHIKNHGGVDLDDDVHLLALLPWHQATLLPRHRLAHGLLHLVAVGDCGGMRTSH